MESCKHTHLQTRTTSNDFNSSIVIVLRLNFSIQPQTLPWTKIQQPRCLQSEAFYSRRVVFWLRSPDNKGVVMIFTCDSVGFGCCFAGGSDGLTLTGKFFHEVRYPSWSGFEKRLTSITSRDSTNCMGVRCRERETQLT
jgi:hypothetical protein